jgi:DNA primase
VRERGTVIVAEGYMDVIALAQAGFGHAVAPLGTAVTEAQLVALWQLADEPVLCLDSDEAGLRAGARVIERALPLLKPGKSLRFALLPQGADPDEVLRIWGRQRLGQTLAEAKPLAEFLWDSETRQRSFDTPERRAALRQRLIELCRTIPDAPLRQAFRDELEKRIAGRFGTGRSRRPERGAPLLPRNEKTTGAARLAAGLTRFERAKEHELLASLLSHPELLDQIEEELAALEFSEPELARLHDGIVSWYAEQGHLDLSGMRDHLCSTGFASLIEQLSADDLGPCWYRRPGLEFQEVLEGWCARAAQLRRFAERRAVGQAAADAIAAQRAEAGTYRVAVDRLINESAQGRAKTPSKQ